MQLFLIAMIALLGGCLAAPEGDNGTGEAEAPDSDDGAADLPAPPTCPGSFTVAYANHVIVHRDGGEIRGILLIEAITDGVDFTKLSSWDDSFHTTFTLYEPSYVVAEPGTAHGELCDAAEPLIVDNGVAASDWAVTGSPAYGLIFDPVGPEISSETVRGTLGIADLVVDLKFVVEYQDEVPGEPVLLDSTTVTSTCPE